MRGETDYLVVTWDNDNIAEVSRPITAKEDAIAELDYHRTQDKPAVLVKVTDEYSSIAGDSTASYNGWLNRETWAAHLWITNEQGMYNHFLALPDADAVRDEIGEIAQDVYDGAPTEAGGMISDIGSLWRVDWQAVYDALHEEYNYIEKAQA